LSLFILWVRHFSYREAFYFFLRDPWVKHLKVFFFRLLSFSSYFTPWAFSYFFPQDKVQPLTILANPMPKQMHGMDEQEDDEK